MLPEDDILVTDKMRECIEPLTVNSFKYFGVSHQILQANID